MAYDHKKHKHGEKLCDYCLNHFRRVTVMSEIMEYTNNRLHFSGMNEDFRFVWGKDHMGFKNMRRFDNGV